MHAVVFGLLTPGFSFPSASNETKLGRLSIHHILKELNSYCVTEECTPTAGTGESTWAGDVLEKVKSEL